MTQPADSTVDTAAGTRPGSAEQVTDAAIAEGAAVEANQLVLDLLQAHRADTTRTANLDIDILARRFVDARPWGFDTTATDALVVHAATLREASESTADAEHLDGYTPQVANAAADQIEQIALHVGALGGFPVRSAEEIRADAGAPGKHASETRHDAAAAEQAPAGDSVAAPDDSVADAELDDAVIEHALVGTLVHVPDTLDDIAKFLRPEDISHQRVRVAYTVLQQLHEERALVEVSALDTDRERVTATHTNHQTLLRALRASALPQAGTLVAELTTAASTNSLLDRHERVPEIQLRMARTVLANAARRAITAAGVRIRRASLLTLVPGLDPARVTRAASEIRNSVDQLAQRLATAGGPSSHHGDGDKLRQLLSAPARTASGAAGLLARRAERDLMHLALRGNTEVLMYGPQDFTRREHANTWRAIQNLQARGEPINYVSVFSEQRALPAQHRPALSAHQLQRLENRDLITPSEIRRAFAVVTRSAIRRDARQLNEVTRDLAGRTDLPVDTVVAAAQLGHDTTTRFARTALDRAQRRPGRT